MLETRKLRRIFGKNELVAVDNISLSVEPGTIHALLGPNGAGKTTTVRMCATLLAPTEGEIWVDGIDAVRDPESARRRLGLMLGGELGFYPRATARDNLLFFADLQGLPGSRRHHAVDEAFARVDLSESATRKAGEFSRGMLQRLHMARALLGNPALLLLDEPTMGLDPDIALQMRDLINDLASEGTSILLTSHSMPEVEELADTISVIGAGRIVTRGAVSDIASFAGVKTTTTFTLSAKNAEVIARLKSRIAHDGTVQQRPSSGRWAVTVYWAPHANPASGIAALEALLADVGAKTPVDLVTRPASLEEAYLALTDRLVR